MAGRTRRAAMIAALGERLSASRLPGEDALAADDLAAIAAFLRDCAGQRGGKEPFVAVESVPGAPGARKLRIAAINPDMPFLVDSLAACVAAHGLAIDRLLHPVVPVQRDGEGRIADIGGEGAARESLVYLETGRADARTRVRLRAALEEVLADVHAAVADWQALRAALEADAARIADSESADLLRWFAADRLTLLGYEVRRRRGAAQEALGICRRPGTVLLRPESWTRAFAWFEADPARAVLVIKANAASRVHRAVPMDLILVPRREQGRVTALAIHAALWTSAALDSLPQDVPLLRERLAALRKRLGIAAGGHDGKALTHAFARLPHDLLVMLEPADLERLVPAMMSLVDRPRPRLVLIRSPLDRHLFAFVWLPRDAMSTEVRLRIIDLLRREAQAEVLDWSLEIEGSQLAMLRFVLDIRDGDAGPDEAAVEAQLCAMVRGWAEAVEAELALEPGRAAAIAARHAEAFPIAYRAAYGPAEAARDIARLRALGQGADSRDVRLHRMAGDGAGELRLKLYEAAGEVALSDAVPVLENFGFRVVEDRVTDLAGDNAATIHDFLLALPPGLPPGLSAEGLIARARVIEPAIRAVLAGSAGNDGFNRLVTLTGLDPQEAGWLRAIHRYLRQVGNRALPSSAVEALTGAPQVTRGLVALLRARHDPALDGQREEAEAQAQEAIRQGLAGVAAIAEDRLLRAFRVVIEAILRTNAFIPAGRAALAFKLDCAAIPGLPRPVPWREIFVHCPRVEGVHLRAGPVARGGIRWSDRRDDFRTEVLGLMKAQRVKNAVIVPTGAKGGFYPRQLPDPRVDREAWLAEGREAYKVFIRALLSLTDTIAGRRVVHPAGLVVRDGEDPYFVVAADKGTASYSDTANALAAEAGFWLDDAFASGGSRGD